LLQPLNVTPIQPRLGESNLFLLSAGGPNKLSFNEFNSLFKRDRGTLLASGLAGENGTFGGESVISGIHQKTSYSIGLSHFETDGFHSNNHQQDTILNAFIQQELTPDTSIQAEYRYRDNERGDLQQRFFPADVFSNLMDKQQQHSFRLGARHAFTPSSMLLSSFIYQEADTRIDNDDFPEAGGFINLKIPENAFGGELLTLFRLPHFNLKSGIGYFDIDAKIESTIGFAPPDTGGEPITVQSTVNENIRHLNLYAYTDFNLLSNLTASLGASFDSINGDLEKRQFNPKVGITWSPLLGTIVRAAAFKTLKRTLINNQTLEPTQVAGFNQFFDDANLSKAWRYGAAIDQKFSNKLFAGMELSKRDLAVPFLDISDDGASLLNRTANWDETLGRSYLFWTPHSWLALSADYWFERYKREEQFAAGVRELDTHRVLFGVNWFAPSGLSASLTSTYWNQDGRFERLSSPTAVQFGHDDFWTVDAEIGYRLPQRYGFISVGATNLFDEQFKYFEIDVNNSTIQPVRTFFVKFTLALP
jgi:hypothetical protein